MLPEVLNKCSDKERVAKTDKYDCASWRKPGNLRLCTFHFCHGSSSRSNCEMASYIALSVVRQS